MTSPEVNQSIGYLEEANKQTLIQFGSVFTMAASIGAWIWAAAEISENESVAAPVIAISTLAYFLGIAMERVAENKKKEVIQEAYENGIALEIDFWHISIGSRRD